MKKIGILPLILAAAMISASVMSTAIHVSASDITAAEHTPSEIKAYCEANTFDLYGTVSYDEKPSSVSPYKFGKLSASTEKNALNALNCARYIAGLPAVSLSSSCSEYTQAASVVLDANKVLSHSPDKPAGMSDTMYQKGKTGASSSNLSYRSGTIYLAHIVLMGYMDDSDKSNLSRLGHRRWCLNPDMDKTGFGACGNYAGMYSVSMGRNGKERNVCWPARNMPLEYFRSEKNGTPAWSISTGQNIQAGNVTVTLTRKNDGKTWRFGSSSADGDFYVDNGGYGVTGCVIFRPKDIKYASGDMFNVKITLPSDTIEYSVNFFSLNDVYAETGTLTLGNINYDTYIDASDASAVLSEYSRRSTGQMSFFNSEQNKTADVNRDGRVDSTDASKILEYYSYASTAKNPVSMEKWLK